MFKPLQCAALSVALATALVALAADPATPSMPPIVNPLPKPDADGQKPRATVMLAHYRYDDILWENDRTAHRIYGLALQAAAACVARAGRKIIGSLAAIRLPHGAIRALARRIAEADPSKQSSRV